MPYDRIMAVCTVVISASLSALPYIRISQKSIVEKASPNQCERPTQQLFIVVGSVDGGVHA